MQTPIRNPLLIPPIQLPRIHPSFHSPRPIPCDLQTNALRIKLRTHRRIRPVPHSQMRLMKCYDFHAQHIRPALQRFWYSDVPTAIILSEFVGGPVAFVHATVDPPLFADLHEAQFSCVDTHTGIVTCRDVVDHRPFVRRGPGPGIPPAYAHGLASGDGCANVCGGGAVGADYTGGGEVDWVEGVAAAVGCVLFLINMWVDLGGVRLPSLECCLGRVLCHICLGSCNE
jgi:hypothetical protein